jgi:chromosome segregation ATPase
LLDDIQAKQDRIEVLQTKINANQSETQHLFSTAQTFQQTVAELKLLKEKVQHSRSTMTSLRNDMQEYTESDDELVAMRDSFGQRNADAQAVMREKVAMRKKVTEELGKVREELGRKTVEMGGLEEARRANERSLARREDVVKEVARRHGYQGMDVIMDESQIDEIKALLLRSLKDEKGHLDRLKVPTSHIVS